MTKSKTKPNDPCHCGSGKKYKKCCSLKHQQHQGASQQHHEPVRGSDKNIFELDVEHEQDFCFRLGYGKAYIAAIENCLEKFLEEQGNNDVVEYPALDFCSGACVFPVEYVKHFRNNSYPLTWYCSEYTCPLGNRDPLAHLAACQVILMNHQNPRGANEKDTKSLLTFPQLVCADVDGYAIFREDRVNLSGLKNERFNGLTGVVQGLDLSSKTTMSQKRVAVLLQGREKSISFKPESLILVKKGLKMNVSHDKAVEMRTEFEAVKSLCDNRTLNIDVQNEEHCWLVGHKMRLEMRCAIVTCMSLLTQVGRRIPMVWQDALNRSSYFLQEGGYYLHHDTIDFGGFGDEEKMREYGKKCMFEMELVSITEPVKHPKDMKFVAMSGKMKLVIWKKTCSQQ